jgi:nickel superoxide dismutase
MKGLVRSALRLLDRAVPPETVHAHCDIPCGIYDPHLAHIGALSVIRMNQLIGDLSGTELADRHKLIRYTAVKEEHAELVKREVRIIWGDYFKPEHAEKYPELHGLVWDIMKLGSTVRQNVDMAAAEQLLGKVQRFAEIFWESKGVATKKQPSNQAAGGEYVVPAN